MLKRVAMLLICLAGFTGCTSSLDRVALDELYQSTALAHDAVWSMPARFEPGTARPRVVNWWYAGTRRGEHYLVFREVSWSPDGKPIGRQRDYRVAQAHLAIAQPMPYTQDSLRWLPLFEAAPDRFATPAGLATTRKGLDPAALHPESSRPAEFKPVETQSPPDP